MSADRGGRREAIAREIAALLQALDEPALLEALELMRARHGLSSRRGQDALRRELLTHLRDDVYCKLGVSELQGVGVFAVRDIPAGVNPFDACNRGFCGKEVSLNLSQRQLRDALGGPRSSSEAAAVMQLVKSFCAPLTQADGRTPLLHPGDGTPLYGVNATGLNTLDMSWYLNHSDTPNMAATQADEATGFSCYSTSRPVRRGEELTLDYRELGPEYHELVLP